MALAAALLLAGCGSDDGSAEDGTSPSASPSSSAPASSVSPTAEAKPTTTPAPAGTPDCAQVWQVGSTLPKGYAGCAEAGVLVAPDGLGCSSGQVLVRYDERLWAVRGGAIAGGDTPLQDSKEYRKIVSTCRG